MQGLMKVRTGWFNATFKHGLAVGATVALCLVFLPGCPGTMGPCQGDPCADGDPCTTNICTPDASASNGFVCSNTPVDCMDQVCNPADGECVDCVDDADCDNGEFCDGSETCGDGNTCSAGTDPCTEDQSCDEESDTCRDACTTDGECDDGAFCNGAETCDDDGFCSPGSSPCAADQTCNEETDTCEGGTGLSVGVSGCPSGSAAVGSTVTLTANVSGATGNMQSFNWTITGGSSFASSNGTSTIDVTVGGGDTTVTVTVTDFNDSATSGFIDEASDDCMFNGQVVTTLTVNAGSDRAFNEDFGVGATVTPMNQNTLCIASDPNFVNAELIFDWTVVNTPSPATAANVIISNSSDDNLNVSLLPVAMAQALRLRQNGTTNTVDNIAIPGEYTFQCQVTNPNGDTATDDVTLTISPAFTVMTKYEDNGGGDDLNDLYGPNNNADTSDIANNGVPGPVLNGLALANGELTNYVTSTSSVDITFAGLFRQSGAINFAAFNLDSGESTSLNTAAVTADGTMVQNVVCMVTGLEVGTYAITASYTGATGSTAASVTDAVVHVQPDLPTEVSIVGDVGPIDSTAGAPEVHGSSGGSDVWVSQFIVQVDTNMDGVDDIIVVNSSDLNVIFTTSDPSLGGGNDIFDNSGGHFADYTPGQAFPGNTNATYTPDLNTTLAGFDIHSIAVGDLNGDGFPDLAIGQARADNGANGEEGRVTVVYHRGEDFTDYNPGAGDDPWDEDDATIAAFNGPDVADAAGGFMIGYNVAIGNVVGNSIDDLVFSAPGMDDDADNGATGVAFGRVYVFTGSAAGFGNTSITETGVNATTTFGGTADLELAGAGLALGHFRNDGDAFMDIAVGVPGYNIPGNNNGAVMVFYGAGSLTKPLVVDTIYVGEANDYLGRRVYAGDFDGNGQDDIVGVGTASATIDGSAVVPGVLYIFANNANSDTNEDLDAPVDFPKMTGGAGENLGWRVAVGDWNQDGNDDMLVSALGDGGTANDTVYLVLGASTLPTTLEESTTFVDVAADVPDNTNPFLFAQTEESLVSTPGSALGIVDVNGDTYLDIFISEANDSAYIAGRND